jgi:hypothetical protein
VTVLRGVALSLVAFVACKRDAPNNAAPPDASVTDSAANDAAVVVDAAPAILPARCKVAPTSVVLATGADSFEVGEGTATNGGFAVGLLRKDAGETVGSVAVVDRALGGVTFADVAAPYADAPPPLPFLIGGDVYAAFFSRDRTPSSTSVKLPRDLSIYRIADGKGTRLIDVPQQRDDSLAFDVATGSGGAALVWDEDAIGNERGDIKLAVLSPDAKAIASSRIVSPDGTDAESPRIVARRGGFWIVWVASRLEYPDAGLWPGEAIERPAEERRFKWLELQLVDDHGAAVGGAKRLTSQSGRVALFDLAARPDAPDVLDILARDDDETSEAVGARIVRITVTGDKPDPPIAIVGDGVGRGVPDLLPGGAGGVPAAWLSYSNVHDASILVPLGPTRTPLGAPSAEDALDKARPIVVAGASDSLLAAFSTDAGAELRIVTCGK